MGDSFNDSGKTHTLFLKNVKVFTEEGKFLPGEILCRDGAIVGVYTEGREGSISAAMQAVVSERNNASAAEDMQTTASEKSFSGEIIDGQGAYAIPGLIDMHLHGCLGADFCDGTPEAIRKIAEYEVRAGITAFAPATMTLPAGELMRILKTAAEYKRRKEHRIPAADLIGINMEGPFISPAKKGAQDERNILPCDAALSRQFLAASEGLVKFIGLAPEENPAFPDFIREVKGSVSISLAHTNADYDTAIKAFHAGANHVVHLYNAMSPFSHRQPGVVGAAIDCPDVMAEIICDGVHVHPAMVRAALALFGDSRLIFISDSMRGTGMPEGRYTLGGLLTEVRDGRATLVSDGSLAGSVTNLMDCLRTAVLTMGIPLETAVLCSTRNPAVSLGVYDKQGSLSVGKKADLVLLSENLATKLVIKDGINLEQEE